MNIPTEFYLGGIKWTVKRVKRLKGAYGDCNTTTATIRIRDDGQTDPLLIEQTFCHELTHAIQIAMGKPGDEHDEKFTDAFATFLHQYLNTAK